jgi:hypothetical protein
VSNDVNHIQQSVIKALHRDGKSISWIAESLDLSRTTVHSVLNNKGGKRQRQRADRYEAFFRDVGSGCYLNGEELLSSDQARTGDPLDLLMVQEEINLRMENEEWDY